MMELVDGLGQTTRLSFDQIQKNPPLDPALFQFTPPAGVDVIGEQE
jgi:outer membrane lipoprotein carrier protein